MTHEELLANIDEKIESVESVSLIMAVPWRVLRAVVELHKPHDITWTGETVPETFCEGCNEEYYVKYPCPTIQAIQEQLK